MRKVLAIALALLGCQDAAAMLRHGGGAPASGTPIAVTTSPAPDSGNPFVFDSAGDGTAVSTVAITMSSGAFSGTLGFRTIGGSDLAIDATTATNVTSLGHSFSSFFGGSDLAEQAFTSAAWQVSSASHTFVAADIGAQVQILGGTGWNALGAPGNSQCPSDELPCAWTIYNLAGQLDPNGAGLNCPASPAGSACLMHTPGAGVNPFLGASGLTGGVWRITTGTDIGQSLQVTGGAGCTIGTYKIIGFPGGTGSGAGAILDKPAGTPGSVCNWTLTYDGGGAFRLAGLSLRSNGILPAGDSAPGVVIQATQNAVTATSALLPVQIVSSGARQQLGFQGVKVSPGLLGGATTTGYNLSTSFSFANPGVDTGGGTMTPNAAQWVHLGGDCIDKLGASGACPVASGTAYATFSSLNNATTQTWTFDAAQLIADTVGIAADAPILVVLHGTNTRTIINCSDATVANRPVINVTYSDTTTDALPCAVGVTMQSNDSAATSGSFISPITPLSSSNVGLQFARPNGAKTVSAATLAVVNTVQTGGTSSETIWRPNMPVPTSTVTTGLANAYTQDGCVINVYPCAIESNANVLFFYEGGELLSGKYVSIAGTGHPSYTVAADYDYTCPGDPTKLPRFGAGKLVGDFQDPVQVSAASYSQYGYKALGAQVPNAWMIPGGFGIEDVFDANYVFKTTDTGDQSHACLDGQTVTAGHATALGQLPTELWVRFYVLNGTNFWQPDLATLQIGGKTSPGTAHLGICGNGGQPCFGSQTNGITPFDTGRIGWSNRNDGFESPAPFDYAYRKLVFGNYVYSQQSKQNSPGAYNYGPLGVIPRGNWHSVETHYKMNSYVATGGTALGGAACSDAAVGSTLSCGTGYQVGDVCTIPGGTFSVQAQVTVATIGAGGSIGTLPNALTVTQPGTYTVFPVPTAPVTPSCTGVGTGAILSIGPVNTSTADGRVDAYVDGKLAYSSAQYQWRGTPPWVPLSTGSGTARPFMVSNGGIRAMYWNFFRGGVYGGIAQPFNVFYKNLVIATAYVGPMKP